ncbi:MAG: hypothetical protein KDD53_00705 [Bdellovibrionales bacterium]|nr:hypothetical protein [Bdellovibrionales bacterium]
MKIDASTTFGLRFLLILVAIVLCSCGSDSAGRKSEAQALSNVEPESSENTVSLDNYFTGIARRYRASVGDSNLVTEYTFHRSGTRKLKLSKVNEVVSGETKVYYPSGVAKVVGSTVNGEVQKEKIEFDSNGSANSASMIKPFESVDFKLSQLIVGVKEQGTEFLFPAESNNNPVERNRLGGSFEFRDSPAGMTVLRVKYNDGMIEGIASASYTTGDDKMECRYSIGALDGPYRRYAKPSVKSGAFERGFVKEQGAYQDGILNGTVTVFQDKNVKLYEFDFNAGVLDGRVAAYHSNGKLKEECRYKKGSREGQCRQFGVDGTEAKLVTYVDGRRQGLFREAHPNGQTSLEGNYVNGKLSGELVRFDSKGNLTQRKIFRDGVEEGKSEEFYPQGQVRVVSNYVAGKREGEQKSYFADGKISALGNYLNGHRHGKQLEYYRSGKIKKESDYWHGKMTAEKSYLETGIARMEAIGTNTKQKLQYIDLKAAEGKASK